MQGQHFWLRKAKERYVEVTFICRPAWLPQAVSVALRACTEWPRRHDGQAEKAKMANIVVFHPPKENEMEARVNSLVLVICKVCWLSCSCWPTQWAQETVSCKWIAIMARFHAPASSPGTWEYDHHCTFLTLDCWSVREVDGVSCGIECMHLCAGLLNYWTGLPELLQQPPRKGHWCTAPGYCYD